MPIYSHECECGDSVVDKLYDNYASCPKEYEGTCEVCKKDNIKFKKILTTTGGFRLVGDGWFRKTSTFD